VGDEESEGVDIDPEGKKSEELRTLWFRSRRPRTSTRVRVEISSAPTGVREVRGRRDDDGMLSVADEGQGAEERTRGHGG